MLIVFSMEKLQHTNTFSHFIVTFQCSTCYIFCKNLTFNKFWSNLMHKVHQVVFFFFAFFLVAYSRSIEYHYPLNNTSMHSIRTPIILRFDSPIELNDIIQKVTIKGNKFGKYNFDASLSDDKRTVTITTRKEFSTSEKVEVICQETSFSFYTTSLTPREQLNLFLTFFSEKYPVLSNAIRFASENKTDGDKPLSDTIPADFPTIIINKSTTPSEGYIYIANFGMGAERSYLMILDQEGKPIKYRKVPIPGFDFKMQPNGLITNNRIVTSYIPQGWGWATAIMEVMDKNLNVIDSVKCGSFYIADFHEFKMLPNGHYLLLSYDPQPIDMTQVIPNGDPNAIVLGSIIQELDGKKNVVFQWRSWDHIPITDTYSKLTGVSVDPVHTNAIELDYDGNILISSRHLSEITKISRRTGKIIWRLGGKKNMFNFINDHEEYYPTYFSYQHDIRRLPNGNITLYDNGNLHNPPHSRAVEYKLDEENYTAELVWEYRNKPDIFGETMGSTQRLYPSGNTLIGWGGVSSEYYRCVSEVASDSEVVFELSFPKGLTFTTTSYRAYKYPYPPNLPETVVQIDDIQSILAQQSPNDTLKFETGNTSTGVSISFANLTASTSSFIKVEKYHYAPLYPKFKVTAPLVNEYKVFILSNGISYSKAYLKFDLTQFPYCRHWQNLRVWRRNFNDQFFYPLNLTMEYNPEEKALYCMTDTLDGEYIFAMSDIYELPGIPILHDPPDSSIVRYNTPIIFRWTAQGYANSSDFQVARDPSFQIIRYSIENILGNSIYINTNIRDTGIYYWRVRARNNSGETEWSKPFRFYVKFPFLDLISPRGGEVWQKGRTYEIRWFHNLNNDFSIILYENNSPYQYVVDSVYSATGKYLWQIPDYIPEGNKYKIMVQSISEKDFYAVSPDFFSIMAYSKVNENFSDIRIYPTPAFSEIYLKLDLFNEEIIRIDVIDLLGRKVEENLPFQTKDEKTITANIGNLSMGIYFLQVQGKNWSRKLPFIKANN